MTRKSAPSLSLEARQFQQRVSALVRDYESSLGPIPVWFAELDLERALTLMGSCLRVGMRLPSGETLQMDKEEQREQWHLRNLGRFDPNSPVRDPGF